MNNNNEIKVDKDVPLPPTAATGIYPWVELEIGDSLLAPGATLKNLNTTRELASRRLQRKFVARTVDGGVRYWRIK